MPHVFGHGSNLKLVSAAGLAPAIPRFQAGHVAATPRAVAPANGWRRGLVSVEMESAHLGERDSIEDGGPEGSCTLNLPADNGALCCLSYESEMACQAEALAKVGGKRW